MAAPSADHWHVLFLRDRVFFCLCVCAWKNTSVVLKWAVLVKKRSYMYLSSDSLRTRMSLIRTILHNSPSMSSTVMVESAIEITSSVAKRHNQKSNVWQNKWQKHEHIYFEWYTLGLSGRRGHNLISQYSISIGWLRNVRKSRLITTTWCAQQPVSL